MDKEDLMVEVEQAAENCTLNLDHIQALNSSNMTVLMRLYNMCIHTWDPENTWEVYYWNELIPPLIIYRYVFICIGRGGTKDMVLAFIASFQTNILEF